MKIEKSEIIPVVLKHICKKMLLLDRVSKDCFIRLKDGVVKRNAIIVIKIDSFVIVKNFR